MVWTSIRPPPVFCGRTNKHTGERVGCVMFVMDDEDVAIKAESILEQLQRSEVSNPPAYGAKIASTILDDDQLCSMWYEDMLTMSTRILSMRHALYDRLLELGSSHNPSPRVAPLFC
jgi:aspartate aminotransferase